MLTIDPSKGPDLLFDDIRAYIVRTEEQIDARALVDLEGLDTAVEALCTQVLAQPDGKRYSAKLAELMEAIEVMQGKMMTLQSEIAATMKSLSKQKKAAMAYIKTPKGT